MKIKPVENWRHGWKWLSNWAFIIVAFLATPLPPELFMLLTEEDKTHAIKIVAIAGLILRFIDQSKNRTWS